MRIYGDRAKNGAILITTKTSKVLYQMKFVKLSESYLEYLSGNKNNDKDFDYVVDGRSLGKDSPKRTRELDQIAGRVKSVDITINPAYNGTNAQATVTITTK